VMRIIIIMIIILIILGPIIWLTILAKNASARNIWNWTPRYCFNFKYLRHIRPESPVPKCYSVILNATGVVCFLLDEVWKCTRDRPLTKTLAPHGDEVESCNKSVVTTGTDVMPLRYLRLRPSPAVMVTAALTGTRNQSDSVHEN
jgi:hypothetical protein